MLSFSVHSAQNAALIVPPLLVNIGSDMGVSLPVAGQLATVTFAAWAVSVVSGGPLSDSLGRRPMALAGLLILSVSVIASAFAPNLAVLMVMRPATGLGGGMLPPNAMGAIADTISPERRARAFGAVHGQQRTHRCRNGAIDGSAGRLAGLAVCLFRIGPATGGQPLGKLDLVSTW